MVYCNNPGLYQSPTWDEKRAPNGRYLGWYLSGPHLASQLMKLRQRQPRCPDELKGVLAGGMALCNMYV